MYKRVFLSLKSAVKHCFICIKVRKTIKNVNEKISYTYIWYIRVQLILLYNYLINTIMKEVTKFFGLQAGETQVCNGFRFECVKKEVLTKGAAPTLFGTFTAPDGTKTDYTTKGVFANKLNKLAGVANSVVFKSKVSNSQQNGEHKVTNVTMSASKQQKRFMKAYKLCRQASECYGLTDVFSSMLEQLQQLDSFIIHCEEKKAEQLREQMKAEAEAKKAAEEEAKKQAERIETIKNEKQVLFSFGMSAAQVHTMLEQKYGAEILSEVF